MVGKMFEPVMEVVAWFKSLVPDSFKPGRPHFNFITVHCKRAVYTPDDDDKNDDEDCPLTSSQTATCLA